MNIKDHCDHTENLWGLRGEDIHKWIDGYFDREGFTNFLLHGRTPGFNPYDHRRHRHCQEALPDACEEFKGKYSREEIRKVFETHVKDDYRGIIPLREDFINGDFEEKYHEKEEPDKEAILSDAELTEYFKGHSNGNYAPGAAGKITPFQLRIVLPSLVTLSLFILSVFFLVLPYFRSVLLEDKKEMIKELTIAAASIIHTYITMEESGVLSLEEAQQEAAGQVDKIRYGTAHKDYFWITDMHPRMIMHPYHTEMVNQDLTDYVDTESKTEKYLFVEFVKLVEEANEGYLEYYWQWMDDPGKAVPKLSYVLGIPEWDWILGTGVYIHDIEEEMERFTRTLMIVFLIISLVIALLIFYLLVQATKKENQRQKAETGLREAKDRYRALVEASNEGYLLVINGNIIYSNSAMQQMADYSAEELAERSLLSLFPAENPANEYGIGHLSRMLKHEENSGEFTAQIKTGSGRTEDMIIGTSRIFFPEQNGYLVSFRKIGSSKNEANLFSQPMHAPEESSELPLVPEIRESFTVGHVIQVLNQLPPYIHALTKHGVRPGILRSAIGRVYDSAVIKFIEISLLDRDPPPVPFAFLNLGSNARHEMTYFSDQDNALVFLPPKEEELARTRDYFLKLSDAVCSKLHLGGFSFCPGGIMASNPKWCLSLSEWENRIQNWTREKQAQSFLNINVFADLRFVYGTEELSEKLHRFFFRCTAEHPEFFLHYAANCLAYRVPLDLLGRLKGETVDGVKSINIKQILKPLESFARLYSLKYAIDSPSTISRLDALAQNGVITEELKKELIYIFDFLWNLRFFNQMAAHADLRHVNDELVLSELLEVEQKNLQNILSRIQVFQSKISFDFLGTNI